MTNGPVSDPAPDPLPTTGRGESVPTASGATTRSIASRDLFQGARELLIQHEDDCYRLRITKQGKLILHK